jgi:preprotein translocase subunit YajC
VVTNGGIHGQITAVNEKTVSVRVADKVELQIARAAVAMKTEAE